MSLGTSQHVVRYLCEDCQRWWPTDAEYQAHKPICGESDAIVRELAERGPFVKYVFGRPECADNLCNTSNLEGLEEHSVACLWRRAKALYP